MVNEVIPEGYMKDSMGRLVPLELVKPIDRARDELVRSIVSEAREVADCIKHFKTATMGDIEAFVEMSAEEFGVAIGGVKGNVTLTSYDGRYRIMRAIDEYIVFDERIQVAKALIDECIHEWAVGSCSEIRALINDAFQVDKKGRVNTKRILSLRGITIDHEKWRKAMDAIAESIQVAGSKTYLRIYEKADNGEYVQISLDVAA